MALHTLRCPWCGHSVERLKLNKAEKCKPEQCELCGTVMRVELGARLSFKGEGFYVNDYAKKRDAGPDFD